MKTQLTIEFKEMKKNSKHQVLKFEHKGEDEEAVGEILYGMSGAIVVVEIEGCEAGEFNADFFEHKKTHNGFVMQMKIKGDVSDERAGKIYAKSGKVVNLTVKPAQMTIEEFYQEPREGVRGTINSDGTVDVNQVTIEQAAAAADEAGPVIPNVPASPNANTDSGKGSSKRKTKAEKEAEAAVKAAESEAAAASDDDLLKKV